MNAKGKLEELRKDTARFYLVPSNITSDSIYYVKANEKTGCRMSGYIRMIGVQPDGNIVNVTNEDFEELVSVMRYLNDNWGEVDHPNITPF
jgi:hypothetical protein